MALARESAELIAIRALGWIAGQGDVLPAFLDATGLRPGDLRAQAADPAFLGAVLDFLMGSDALVLAFAAAEGVSPEAPRQARAMLPGAAPEWG